MVVLGTTIHEFDSGVAQNVEANSTVIPALSRDPFCHRTSG